MKGMKEASLAGARPSSFKSGNLLLAYPEQATKSRHLTTLAPWWSESQQRARDGNPTVHRLSQVPTTFASACSLAATRRGVGRDSLRISAGIQCMNECGKGLEGSAEPGRPSKFSQRAKSRHKCQLARGQSPANIACVKAPSLDKDRSSLQQEKGDAYLS